MSKADTPNEPFNQALREYSDRLDLKERKTFEQSITTPDDLLDQVQQLEQANEQKDKSRMRKLIRRLTTALRDFQTFFMAVETGIATASPFAGLVYGTLRAIIELAHRQIRFFDVVVDTLESISVDLPFYHDYATTLYVQTPAVQRALAGVYQDVFAVYFAVRKAFKNSKGEDRNILTTMFGHFQGELESITDRLAKRQDIVEREARHADRIINKQERDAATKEREDQGLERAKQEVERTKQEVERYEARKDRQKAQEKEQKAKEAEKREEFLKLLAPADCSEKHYQTFQVHTQSECWLLEHPEFKEWYDKPNGLLWCHSKPGAGKTVLMSVVIEHLMKLNDSKSGVPVAYFYCEGDDRRKKDSTVVLASILVQLMQQGDITSMQKKVMIEENHTTKSIHALDLVSLLVKLLQDYPRAYLVIDALDECETEKQETLCTALKTLSQSCNLIVTSRRDEEHIMTVFTDVPQIAIQPEDVRADISHFVTTEVEQNKKLCKKSAILKTEIVDALVNGSDGMFLWVKLQLEHICTRRTDRDIRNALKELPRGLHETYARALEKIQSSQLSLRVLQWVLHANQPLTLEQLAEAVAIEDMEGDEWDTSRIVDDAISLIFDCENLVICTEQTIGWGNDNKVQLVQFIHTSVADFLRESPVVMTPGSPFYPLENVHTTLAVDCLKYMHMKVKQEPEFLQKARLPDFTGSPFVTYANLAWEQHLRSLKTADEEIVQLFKGFTSVPQVLEDYGGGSPLHVALLLDLPLIADFLIDDDGLDLWCVDKNQHTLLHRAGLGNIKVLKKVVERMSRPAESANDKKTEEGGEESEKAKEGSEEKKEPEKTLAGYINLPDDTLSTALHYSAYSGVFEAVKLLVEHGADLHALDNRNTTPLHWASASLKPDASKSVTLLLEKGSDVHAKDHNNGTALHWAADADKLKILLEHGSDINAPGLTDLTALHLAAKKGNLECVRLLLDKSANVNALDTLKKSPLHYASAQFGTSKIVSLLLEAGADVDVDVLDNGKDSPLHFAASFDIENVKLLIEKGAKINVSNAKKRSPLHNAAFEYSNHEVLKYLIEKGADLEAIDENGRTPLHDAASTDFENSRVLIESGANVKALDKSLCAPQHFAASIPAGLNTLKLLAEKGANLHLIDSRDWNVLHIGASTGGYPMVEYLVNEAKLDIHAVDDQNATALHYAVYSGILASCQLLVEKGADISAIEATKKTPLHWACQKNGAQGVVKFLIDKGSDLNATDDRKMTPLHLASQAGSFESVKILLEAKADIAALDNQHCTALHLASRKPDFGGPESVKILLEHGSNVTTLDNLGNTPLHFAGVFSGLESVKLFKEHGADLFAINKQGASVLHWVSGSLTFGAEKVIEFLLDEGAPIQELDKQNWTPLHWSAMFGTTADVRMLLDRGAVVDAVNKQKNTPLLLATSRGGANSTAPYEMIELLLDRGANVNAIGEDSQMPLHFAVKHFGSLPIVKLLVDRGADINALDGFHGISLHQAAANDPTTAKFLIEKGSQVDILDDSKRSPLHHAKFHDTIQLLIEKGADPNAMDKQRSTVLHWTADRSGTHETVKYLVEHGAVTNLVDQFGCIPLHLAAYGGEPESVRYLAEHGGASDLEMLDQHQCTPLFLAAKNPSGFEAMKILVEKGSKINLTDEHRSTPLHWSICHERLEPVQFIVENGAEVNVQDQLNVTPLMVASTRSNLHEIAKFLVEKGADIHAIDDQQSAVIHYAAYSFEAHDTVKFLVDRGVDIEARDIHGSTPAHLSSRSPRGRPSLEILLAAGAQIDVTDKNLVTPLHWSAFYGDHKLVEVVLKAGAQINATDIQQCSSLHLASTKPRIFRLLLEHGADITLKDDKGLTAAHYALYHDLFDVKKMLQDLNIEFDLPEKCDTQLTWKPAFSVVAPAPSAPASVASSQDDPDEKADERAKEGQQVVPGSADGQDVKTSDDNPIVPQPSLPTEQSAEEVASKAEPVPSETEPPMEKVTSLPQDDTMAQSPQDKPADEVENDAERPKSREDKPEGDTEKVEDDDEIHIEVDDGLPKAPLHYANYYWHGITHRQFEIRPKVIDDEDPVIVHTPLETIAEEDEEEAKEKAGQDESSMDNNSLNISVAT